MKKILLIEDRTSRQKIFEQESNISLKNYSDILDNRIDDDYRLFVSYFKEDNFNFDEYDVIISHESAFGDQNVVFLDKLKSHCKMSNKSLVFFSGGLSVGYCHTEDFLHIGLNSKVFYSRNLELYLKNYRQNQAHLFMLIYGEKWELNILLNILEKINYFLNTNDKKNIPFSKFTNHVPLDQLEQLEIELYKPLIAGDWADISEIVLLKEDLQNIINNKVVYDA